MSQRILRGACAALVTAAATVALSAAPAQAGVQSCTTNYESDLTGAPSPIPFGFDFRPTGNFVVYVGLSTVIYGDCLYVDSTICPLKMVDQFVNNPPDPVFVTDYATCATS